MKKKQQFKGCCVSSCLPDEHHSRRFLRRSDALHSRPERVNVCVWHSASRQSRHQEDVEPNLPRSVHLQHFYVISRVFARETLITEGENNLHCSFFCGSVHHHKTVEHVLGLAAVDYKMWIFWMFRVDHSFWHCDRRVRETRCAYTREFNCCIIMPRNIFFCLLFKRSSKWAWLSNSGMKTYCFMTLCEDFSK